MALVRLEEIDPWRLLQLLESLISNFRPAAEAGAAETATAELVTRAIAINRRNKRITSDALNSVFGSDEDKAGCVFCYDLSYLPAVQLVQVLTPFAARRQART
ncbi:hypothetical protein GCM10010522_55650 [Kribbella solani]